MTNAASRDFLALRRNTVLLLVALVLAGTGERLWLGFATKYLETLGAWLWSISPQANFIGAAACGALGTVWFWWFVYRRNAASQAGST